MGKGKQPQKWPHSRQKQIEKEGKQPNIPEPEAGGYLLQAFFQAGAFTITGMGRVPLDWPVLRPFAEATGAISERWEYEALIRMSRAYLEEIEAAKNPLRREPVSVPSVDAHP